MNTCKVNTFKVKACKANALRKEFPFFLAVPALLWQVFFLYLPLLGMIIFSFVAYSHEGYLFSITFKHYLRLLKPVYLRILIDSFSLAFITSSLCLLIGYPIAYFLAVKVKKFKTLFLFLIILPSWSNFIVQVYAWFFLLDRNGFINQLLIKIGLISVPLHMLNTQVSVFIGMVYCFIPFMILPLYSVLEKMDNSLIEASADLGASKLETFKRVIIPLSTPGIYSGMLLVFIPAFGEYAIPTLLSGSKKAYWGSVIVNKFLFVRDWSSGFALAWSGIVFMGLILFGLSFFSNLYKRIFISRMFITDKSATDKSATDKSARKIDGRK